jgi:putative transposase
MLNILISLISGLLAGFRFRFALQTENIGLRHQTIVLKRSVNRPKLRSWDRFLWIWLFCFWPEWRSALDIAKPETVIYWHRKGFRLFWTWKVQDIA